MNESVLHEGMTMPVFEWNHSCTSQCPDPCPAKSQIDQEPAVMELVDA